MNNMANRYRTALGNYGGGEKSVVPPLSHLTDEQVQSLKLIIDRGNNAQSHLSRALM